MGPLYSYTHTHTHVDIHDAFALFDKRGDNKIDATQIGDIMRALGLNPTEAELKKIVKEVDPNGENLDKSLCILVSPVVCSVAST